MLCPSCGSLINDNSSFCEQCGSPVNTEPQSTATYTPEYQPVENYAPTYDAPVYNQAPPMYNQYQTPPAYQPTYVGYSQNAAEPQKRNPGKVCGILSLIFSIICYPFMLAYGSGIPFWIAALILGIVGSSVSKRNGFKNGMAKAGILITLIPLIVFVAAVIVSACVMLVFAVLKTNY